MAAAAARVLRKGVPLEPSFNRSWLTKTETYPIIVCIGFAVGWCGYMSSRHLFTSPDVSLDRARRASAIKDRDTSAKTWVSGHHKYIVENIPDISIWSMGGFKRKYA